MTAEFSPIIRRNKPEVLAPAGSLDTVKIAIDYGADAVYCGGKAFGMRTAPKNLSLEDFEEAVAYAHERNSRIFVTCNILPNNDEVAEMNEYMGQLGDIGVDALIVSDIGVLMAARQVAPNTEIHISTQAGITNYQAANAFASLGASRVVLARELSMDAIRGIRKNVPENLEIEAFVHGSMCMAFSGRCLISQHVTGRDANHGDCAQGCRWKYHVVEEKRPNEFIPVEVTDGGTFLFNSHDMNVLGHIDEILDAGITSLKIEGRAKSPYYVAAMANAYKTAVNEYMIQRGFEDRHGKTLAPFEHRGVDFDTRLHLRPVEWPQWLLEEPMKVTHREYSTGFYYPEETAGENIRSGGYINEWRWVATVKRCDTEGGRVYIHSKNKISPGMAIEFLFPGEEPYVYEVPMAGLWDAEGNEVVEINRPAHEFSLPIDRFVPAGTMIRTAMKR